jgi:DNA-binding winged helix-turn-helix (wHTH) protein
MTTIKFQTFTLDSSSFRLLENNKPKDIEPQLFEVLLLLINNHQRFVSKDELLKKVWSNKVVTENVITRTIYELRKTLNDDPKKQSIIRTVRGKGYQFVANLETSTEQTPLANDKIITTNKSGRLRLLVVLSTVLLLILISFLFQYEKNQPSSIESPLNHNIVAVLPLTVNSESPELSILSHSITDYLSNQLATTILRYEPYSHSTFG